MKATSSAQLFAHCARHAIDNASAEKGRHAQRATTAYERAVIVLRLLLGEDEWSDGYERRLDDCFEMGDGDDVVRHLLAFAAEDKRVENLLETHDNMRGVLAIWRERYSDPQLKLPL